MLVEAAEASNLPANNLEHVFVFFRVQRAIFIRCWLSFLELPDRRKIEPFNKD
jgi:hypothetical protein